MAYNLFLRMHTEQDTFDRLRRIPFAEMKAQIVEYNLATSDIRLISIYEEGMNRVLESRGWTYDDYMNMNDRQGPVKQK
jgi:hypothetical protein